MRCGDFLARGFEIGGAARGEMEIAAFGCEQLRDAEADAARAAGDERDVRRKALFYCRRSA